VPDNLRDVLLATSKINCNNAYAPYSGFHVGAAVVFAGSTQIFSGVNVENSSYGLTICAERTAIFSGLASGARKLSHVAVACRDKSGMLVPGVPCGACLQVMAEFGTPETVIILADGTVKQLRDFLPQPFGL